jgi:ABC-type amino acid transport system permease subunit
MNVFDILVRFHRAFAGGLKVTLYLAGITWLAGLTGGTWMGILAHRLRGVGIVLRSIAFLLAATPFLVMLYWATYPLQALLGVVIEPFYTAVTLLSILNIVGVAEICRTALDDFPREYVLAARVSGLSAMQTVMRIELPLLLRQVFPSLLNLQVSMLQLTLFASLISVQELFRVSQSIDSQIHKPVEIYTALAIFFIGVCAPINGLALWMKHRFTRDISER